jgi:uroporphyrinogen decarboxylase
MKKSPRSFVSKIMPDDNFYDEDHILWKRVGYDYSPMTAPLIDASIDTLGKIIWPDPYDPIRTTGLKEEVNKLFETSDYAIIADIMCRGPFEQAVKLRGYENFLIDLSTNSGFASALLEKITEIIIGFWDVYLAAVGDQVQIVCQGDDIGMQTGLIISPKMYRKFIKPCHKRIYDFIHLRTKAKLFMHSCGAIFDVIPDLIEAGVDILNPIQRNAAKMDIMKIKETFGKDICLWGGGIDINQLGKDISLDQIDGEVKRSLDILAKGGGYVFALTGSIKFFV